MRKNYIIGNWKLNKLSNEVKLFFDQFNKDLNEDNELLNSQSIVYGFAPTFIGLPQTKQLAIGKTMIIAQDVCPNGNGSYTGQVSCEQLLDYDIHAAIIGHSEERKFLGCTDKIVNAKTITLLKNKMMPIICIGESLEQYNAGKTKEVLANQITTIFNGINKNDAFNCVIAYEPLWAIGTGKTPTLDEINDLCKYIREVIKNLYDDELAQAIPLLYGGSVNENNALSIISLSDVDGSLIGGVSLKPDKFMKILKDVLKWQKK